MKTTMGTEKRQKEVKLANHIGKIITLILTAVFGILIIITAYLTGSSLNTAIDKSLATTGKGTSQQIQSMISAAEMAATDIGNYLTKAYKLDSEGYSNMALERIAADESRQYKSIIYDKEILEINADVEKYLTETARNTVLTNEDIAGMGVMFEPYCYDTGIKSYAFYIDTSIGTDGKVESFGEYEEYSQEEYYRNALESKKPVFTEPYEYEGKLMITYAVPVLYGNEVQGVIMADIYVENFERAIELDDKYKSMYATLYNGDLNVVFDSETNENIGSNMSEFYKNDAEWQKVKKIINVGAQFQQDRVREDGSRISAYYYPFTAGGETWWTIIGLDSGEKNFDLILTVVILVITSLVSLLILVFIVISLLKKSIKPIDSVVEAAEQIALGNLDIDIKAQSNDEIGKLAEAFKGTISRLKNIIEDVKFLLGEMAEGNFAVKSKKTESYIGDFENILLSMRKLNGTMKETLNQIMESSDQVALGSNQMAESAQGLAEGATEQASAIEELTATIEEVSTTAEVSAENADKAFRQSKKFEAEAENSNRQMEELTTAMNRISETSQKIEQIIGEIEDIATQTNLLSLNASIEAARAGEAGRGFAVVADQIGKLASDSAQSAVNTRELIGKAIDEINRGNDITGNTSKALQTVIEGIRMLAQASQETSEMSVSQAESMNQVKTGIEQISNVVQSNSAAAEETSATSEELSAQAENLKMLVSKFQL